MFLADQNKTIMQTKGNIPNNKIGESISQTHINKLNTTTGTIRNNQQVSFRRQRSRFRAMQRSSSSKFMILYTI